MGETDPTTESDIYAFAMICWEVRRHKIQQEYKLNPH
jgi:hypothetical protein